jgi:GNAT superfamily N-acetyltransferase
MFQDIFRGESHESIATSYLANAAFASNNTIKLENGEHATLLTLDETWIDRMIELQERETSGNTIIRSAKALQDLFDNGDMAFGIVTQSGQLIGQSTLRLNTALPELLKNKFNAASHAVVGCVMIDPDYQGQGLASYMIEKCLIEAHERDIDYAHARIIANPETGATANPASMRNFRDRFNFHAIAQGQSPESKTPRLVDFMVLKLGN